MKQAESGRSLIEMLAVIGIIGVLSVGIITGVRWGLVSGGSFSLQADVESAAQQVQELCAWSNGWSDCSFTSDDIQDILPENLGYSKSDSGNEFVLTASSVPVRVCRRLMNPLYTTWNQNLIKSIRITGSGSSDTCSNGNGCSISSLTESTWRTACGGAFGGDVTMEFYVVE